MGLDCNNMSVWRGGKLFCAGNRSTRRIRCTSKRHVKRERRRERERQSIMVLVIIRPLLKPYCTFLIDIYLHIPKTLTREREREMTIFKDILHTFVIDLYLHCPKTRERERELPSQWLVLFSWYRRWRHMYSYRSGRRVLLALSI